MSATATEGYTTVLLPVPSAGSRTERRSSGSTRLNGRMPSQLRAVPSTNTGSGLGSSSGMALMPARAGDVSSDEPLTPVRFAGRAARPVLMPESREMARLYDEEGLSFRQIAERFGRSRTTVRWHVQFHGVQPRSRSAAAVAGGQTGSVRVPADEVLLVGELYESGMSYDAIRRELGGRSRDWVRVRVGHSAVGVRSRSEALLASSHPRIVSEEKVARIVALHGVMPAYRVAEDVGVTVASVTRTWLRHGLDVPGGRKANPRPAYGKFPEYEGVPIAPLSAAVDAYALREPERERDLADAAKVDGRLFRSWRRRERRVTHVGTADRVLVALDRLWWEVFDPDLAPGCFSSVRSRDVVAWSEAMLRACELWGDG